MGYANVRPQPCHDEFPAACLLHNIDYSFVLPCVDEGTIDWILLWKYVSQLLDKLPSPVRYHCRKYGRNAENLSRFCEPHHVVHYQSVFVAI